ncbi:MAG: VOC family protein [Acidimicrobiales bacterium]
MSTPPMPARPAFGLNHVEILTPDLDRITQFYVEVFDGVRVDIPAPPGGQRAAVVRLGAASGLAFVEIPAGSFQAHGGREHAQRGNLDHLAVDAADRAALVRARERLACRGASDGAVRDYGPMLSVSFTDPDGMASEVCWIRDPNLAGFHPPVLLGEAALAELDDAASRP